MKGKGEDLSPQGETRLPEIPELERGDLSADEPNAGSVARPNTRLWHPGMATNGSNLAANFRSMKTQNLISSMDKEGLLQEQSSGGGSLQPIGGPNRGSAPTTRWGACCKVATEGDTSAHLSALPD